AERSPGPPHIRVPAHRPPPHVVRRAFPGPPHIRGKNPRMNVVLVGGGRMGEALASGLLAAGWDRDTVAIAEIEGDRRRVLEERLPGVRVVPSPAWAAAEAEVLVVAVKPDDVAGALEACAAALPEHAL